MKKRKRVFFLLRLLVALGVLLYGGYALYTYEPAYKPYILHNIYIDMDNTTFHQAMDLPATTYKKYIPMEAGVHDVDVHISHYPFKAEQKLGCYFPYAQGRGRATFAFDANTQRLSAITWKSSAYYSQNKAKKTFVNMQSYITEKLGTRPIKAGGFNTTWRVGETKYRLTLQNFPYRVLFEAS